MIKIETGKGTMPLMSLLAIWSISLVVNLPGLAISPLLANLEQIFPHTSQFEIQLLTIMPNLIIIPFVILSGKLSESKSKIAILTFALVIYLVSGLLYLLADSMLELIAISALLGLGCGLIIPLSASLLADSFSGKYRMQQLGIKSGIANISLVVATLAVGWLEGGNWRLPFLVYLIPVVPLALSIFLPRIRNSAINTIGVQKIDPDAISGAYAGQKVRSGMVLRRLYGIMALYFFVCYATITISYNLPFLMGEYKMGNTALGVVTALFFLAIFIPGSLLPWIIRSFKQNTFLLAAVSITIGLFLIALSTSQWVIGSGAVFMGMGLGIFQPVIYDKGVECAVSEKKVTLALSFVLATNYVAVTVAPVIVDGFANLFSLSSSNVFPFLFNGFLSLGLIVLSIVFRRSFVFKMNEQYT